MSKQVKSGTGWFLGLLVAAALAVGARTAFASTSGCTPVPPGQAGTCTSQAECEDLCDVFAPGWDTAICNAQDCCHCYG